METAKKINTVGCNCEEAIRLLEKAILWIDNRLPITEKGTNNFEAMHIAMEALRKVFSE